MLSPVGKAAFDLEQVLQASDRSHGVQPYFALSLFYCPVIAPRPPVQTLCGSFQSRNCRSLADAFNARQPREW